MASNNYNNANVTPSSDTFREWVDLTNRITYDHSKVVVTTLTDATGGGTVGNAYVDGFFSANTLMVTTNLTGATPTGSVFGTKAAVADLTISSNTVQQGNLVAQANITHSGMKIVSTGNVDITNGNTSIVATNLHINGTETNIDANTVFTANVNIHSDAADFNIGADEVIVNSSASLFKSEATLNDFNTPVDIDATAVTIDGGNFTVGSNTILNANVDINANTDIDNALTDINSTQINVTGTEANVRSTTLIVNGTSFTVDSNTSLTANVFISEDAANLTIGADQVVVNSSASLFESSATTNRFQTQMDINANMDVDNTLTDFTSTDFNVSGSNATIDSTHVDIHGESLDINSNTNIDGIITGTANVTFTGSNVNIGNANTDTLTVAANVVMTDKVDVKEAVNLQNNITVAGVSTLNGNVVLGSSATNDLIAVSGRVTTNVIPFTNGVSYIGNTLNRFNVTSKALLAETITSEGTTTVGTTLTVTGLSNLTSDVILGSDTSDIIQIPGLVNTAIVPDTSGRVLGSTSSRWDVVAQNINTSASANVGTNVNIGGEANAATLVVRTTSTQTGKVSMGAGLDVTGAVDITGAANVSSTLGVDGAVDIDDTTNSTSTTTGSLVTAGGAGIAKSVVIGEKLKVTDDISALSDVLVTANVAATAVNTGTLHATGAVDLDTTLNVDGNVTLKGDVDLGDASSDTVSFNSVVDTNITPSATNSKQLGTASKRWKGVFSTVNTSAAATLGTSLSVGTTATVTGVSTFANTITVSNGAAVAFPGSGTEHKMVEFGNNSSNAQIFANSGGINIITGTGKITAKTLEITDSAVLPSDTTLAASSLTASNLTVTNKAIFTGTGSDDFLQLGDGSNIITLDMNKAIVNSHFISESTDQDIGADGTRWGEGHFESLIQVGGSAGIVLSDSGGSSTANVTADNIFARDELVGASSSDQQLKDKVIKIDTALDKVELIGGYEFVWNDNIGDYRSGTPDYGVIAQELEDVLPHAVDINSRGYKTVNYNSLIPLLIEAVKELSARVKELEPDPEPEEDIDG